ncbi:hypothetical protein LZ198_05550 [Myxococcus sp. K15C18031901]|uniref:hypothetical protein n=1 Tax=Myxococcus dinghuensis TaxID=2906761 RepID=UPI0020A79FDA|nr:hypothetical protein [Myxococcus dinghuensis]MCP3098343.1 hypothetical protein [Myxococcus dinghuensis]
MRRLIMVLAVLHLAACATTHTNDPQSPTGPIPPATRPDESEARRLGAEADKLLEDGRYEDALFLYRRAWNDGFRHPGALFFAGVIAARAGSADEALIWLERAANEGFDGVNALGAEPSLEPLQQQEAWARIAAKVAANAKKTPGAPAATSAPQN